MRLIDADAFDERVRVAGGMSEEELTEDFKDGIQAVLYMLSKQPTINPEPQRMRGKWVRTVLGSTNGYGTTVMYQCSECECMSISKYNYCPNCGADMRGGQDEVD